MVALAATKLKIFPKSKLPKFYLVLLILLWCTCSYFVLLVLPLIYLLFLDVLIFLHALIKAITK